MISFSFRYSSSKWANFARITQLPSPLKSAVSIIFTTWSWYNHANLERQGPSLALTCHLEEKLQVHQMNTVNLMKTLQANIPNPQSISWSGKCICFARSRFSMFSFGVAHLPIVSTMLVQMKKIALKQDYSPPKIYKPPHLSSVIDLPGTSQLLGGTPQDHERRSTPKYEVVSYQDNLVHCPSDPHCFSMLWLLH